MALRLFAVLFLLAVSYCTVSNEPFRCPAIILLQTKSKEHYLTTQPASTATIRGAFLCVQLLIRPAVIPRTLHIDSFNL